MGKTNKRLRRIERLLQRFAEGEKRIVDLIVGLTVENLERRMGQRVERMAAELHQAIVRDLAERLDGEGELEERIERAVRRALREHRAEERELERRAEALLADRNRQS